jgi:hypothetical protein
MKTLAAILAILVVLLTVALFLIAGAYRDCRNLKSEQFDFAKIEVIEHAHQMANKDLVIIALKQRLIKDSTESANAHKSWGVERKGYQRQLMAISTKSATAPTLDSIQRALYGLPEAPEVVHVIPLDYSRKLTGDALRVPILERMNRRGEERYDSSQQQTNRIMADAKLVKETMGERVRLSEDYAHVLEGNLKESIAEKADLDRKWRRKRRVERALEIVVLIVIASI